jgi:hypothetical protein
LPRKACIYGLCGAFSLPAGEIMVGFSAILLGKILFGAVFDWRWLLNM